MFFEQLSSKASLSLKLAVLVIGVLGILWSGFPEPSKSGLAPSPASSTGLPALPQVPQNHVPSRSASVSVTSYTEGAPSSPLSTRVDPEQPQDQELTVRLADLNASPAEELEHLPGIGSVLAARIVAHRMSHGPFRRIEELLLVPGIGQKRLQQLRPFVSVREFNRTSHLSDYILRTPGFRT